MASTRSPKLPVDIGQSVESHLKTWYQVLQQLGRGGNATTFLVVATTGPYKGVLFAMKAFRELAKPERRQSFLGEIQFLMTCNHPSVMRVFDEGLLQEKFPFVIAEYLPLTLRSVIRANNVSAVAKVSYVVQLLSALSYLANLPTPVVHRDVKPENIFLKGQSCVLGDFGLMKTLDAHGPEDQESVKQSIGFGMPYCHRTPDLVHYLVDGEPPTCKSDVFQLGLVAAELLTGENPQRPTNTFTDPVELNKVGPLRGAIRRVGGDLIQQMLVPEATQRDSAADFLTRWSGAFASLAKQTRDLEGKVF